MPDLPGQQRSSSNTEDSPDTLLGGKYRVNRVIGAGAFGRVYLVFDPLLLRNAAIKELLASRAVSDPAIYKKYLDRFQREARAAGHLEHPNIVDVYELAVDKDDNYFLAMQYVDGTDLRALLNQVGTLPVERAVSIALDVADALETIHEHDLVHRDLKPANIMITSRGTAKITDFGIAQVGNESHQTPVTMGHPGTAWYMSPEQGWGIASVDGRSDLYSLGLVLYEMLGGEPYARRRQPLAQLKSTLPPRLYSIVERLTQGEPGERYQSAGDLVTDLRQLSRVPPIPVHHPDLYQVPGIDHAPAGQQVWTSVPAQDPPTTLVGGVPLPYAGARIASPPPVLPPFQPTQGAWVANPVQPAPLSRDQAKVLTQQRVRIRPGRGERPEPVIDNRAILRKILVLFLIAFVVWVGLAQVAVAVKNTSSAAYAIIVGVWVLVMFGAPIALIVMGIKMRARAKTFIKGIEKSR